MENTTTIALSRLVAQSRAMDVTANNLANASTPGYRTERMLFSDYLVREPTSRDTGGSSAAARTFAYTQDRATYRDTQEGTLAHTANPLDLAISGDGYFTVQTSRGPRLTRGSHFERAQDGTIVDGSGQALLDTTGKPMQLSPTDLMISVSGTGLISSENGQIGQVGVVMPSDSNKLRDEGYQMLASDSPTSLVVAPKITQGTVEASNVEPTREVTRMMTDMREFQFTSQFVQAEADRQQSAIDKITQRRS